MTYGLPDSAVLGTTKRLSGSIKRYSLESSLRQLSSIFSLGNLPINDVLRKVQK